MALGLDSDDKIVPEMAARLAAQGYKWCARYIGPPKKEPLTRQECIDLSAAGLYVVVIFESFGDHIGFFNEAQGLQDGAYAYAVCIHIGVPQGSTIYFAGADFDASQDEVDGPISDYFRGIRTNWASQNEERSPSAMFLLGCYGGGLACQTLKDAGLVHRTWLAYSGDPPGWAGGDWSDWNIKQTGAGAIDGLNSDPDVSSALGGGGFQISA